MYIFWASQHIVQWCSIHCASNYRFAREQKVHLPTSHLPPYIDNTYFLGCLNNIKVTFLQPLKRRKKEN